MLGIFNQMDFRIDESIGTNSKKHEKTNCKSVDNNWKIEFTESPLNAYRCSAICSSKYIMWKLFQFNSAWWKCHARISYYNMFCEELSHPHLFPTEKFGSETKAKVQLTPTKYLNQRLLNYTQKFSPDFDYIFFAYLVMQKLNLSNQINIAIREVTSNQLAAGSFSDKVKKFIATDQAFAFMNNFKGISAF